jgi:hypothetical protein
LLAFFFLKKASKLASNYFYSQNKNKNKVRLRDLLASQVGKQARVATKVGGFSNLYFPAALSSTATLL